MDIKLESTRLTCQTSDMTHKTKITMKKKTNHNKLWSSISNKPSVER
jgi:hypothetical protein